MIGGSIDFYGGVVSQYVVEPGMPFRSVGHRLAPEATGSTTLAVDVYVGLTWLETRGPAAGAASLARDRHLPMAKQTLIHSMLDDRNTTPGHQTGASHVEP
jgi:acetyl esterase/lipase